MRRGILGLDRDGICDIPFIIFSQRTSSSITSTPLIFLYLVRITQSGLTFGRSSAGRDILIIDHRGGRKIEVVVQGNPLTSRIDEVNDVTIGGHITTIAERSLLSNATIGMFSAERQV